MVSLFSLSRRNVSRDYGFLNRSSEFSIAIPEAKETTKKKEKKKKKHRSSNIALCFRLIHTSTLTENGNKTCTKRMTDQLCDEQSEYSCSMKLETRWSFDLSISPSENSQKQSTTLFFSQMLHRNVASSARFWRWYIHPAKGLTLDTFDYHCR